MTAGLIVAVVVLLAGTAIGLWRRRTDGSFRPRPTSAPGAPASAAVPTPAGSAASVSASAGSAASVSAPAGSAASAAAPAGSAASAAALPSSGEAADLVDGSGAAGGRQIDAALLAALGADQPADATLLQFSSAFCAPCRAVRRISGEVAAMIPGVRHVEVDAESNLDAVRTLDIWRTPTLLVLDAEGREIKRATGVPGKPQLIAALGTAIRR